MKTCAQCRGVNDDEFLFCLSCGNALGDEGEQETVVNERFAIPPSPEYGFPLFAGNPPGGVRQDAPNLEQQSPYQTPATASVPQTSTAIKVLLVFVAAVAAITLMIVVVVYIVSSGKNSSSTTEKYSTAGNSANPATNVKKASPLPQSFERDYEGTVNGRPLSIHLKRDENRLSGTAITSKTDELTGTIEPDGTFTMRGYENGNAYKGIWSGRINDDGTIDGSWTKTDGTKETPFSVAELR